VDGVFVATPKVKKRAAEDLKEVPKKRTPKVGHSDWEPPIAKANFRVGKKFNPHTVDIDPSRIL
jgi:hypothetical protein